MKHYIITLIFLSLTALIYISIQNAQLAAASAAPIIDVLDIPTSFSGYTQYGTDEEPDESVKETLQTSAILMRTYRAPSGRPIYLTIVYAGTTRRSLHFPEVCLVGQGWEIREQSTMPVGFHFSASKLNLVRAQRNDAVLYWYKTGDRLTGNFFENSWHWACEQLSRGKATSAMFRVSSPILQGDAEGAFQALEDFSVKFTPVLLDSVD